MLQELMIKITTEDGLHARPAGLFVKTATQFQSSIEVEFNGMKKNGKSIMSLLTLGATKGDELKIIINGDDSAQATKALSALIDSGFSQGV